jgi:hypothetical protein
MYSGRRSSVQRHIDNPNIHNGNSGAIPFTEYLVGRRQGSYPPGNRPSFGQKTIEEKVDAEIANLFAKRVAESCLPVSNDQAYVPHELRAITRSKIRERESDREDFLDLHQMCKIFREENAKMGQHSSSVLDDAYDLTGYREQLEIVMFNRGLKMEKIPESQQQWALEYDV